MERVGWRAVSTNGVALTVNVRVTSPRHALLSDTVTSITSSDWLMVPGWISNRAWSSCSAEKQVSGAEN